VWSFTSTSTQPHGVVPKQTGKFLYAQSVAVRSCSRTAVAFRRSWATSRYTKPRGAHAVTLTAISAGSWTSVSPCWQPHCWAPDWWATSS